jgi:E3 ubiquitin-protein ligase BAH
MYTWREILKIYLDAQVFVGDQETDRSTRSSEKAQKQLQWFVMEMERSKLIQRFKLPKSKLAFNTFFQLNSELITMKQFKELNQMAMTKILKKHDKRTSLL